MPNLKHTPQSLLVSAVSPRLKKNRRLLEEMAGLGADRLLIMSLKIKVDESECWLWTGFLNHGGYGKFYGKGKHWRVHRLIWMLVNGFVGTSVAVCHKCDVRACCNPDHLFTGTWEDNWSDMRAKGRHSRGVKVVGHVLTEDDVRNMRRRKASGEHWKSIWADFPIGWRAFFRVIKGERWAHVQ